MTEFLFSYRYRGSRWSLTIGAEDEVDARRRLKAIISTARYDGVLVQSRRKPNEKTARSRSSPARKPSRRGGDVLPA